MALDSIEQFISLLSLLLDPHELAHKTIYLLLELKEINLVFHYLSTVGLDLRQPQFLLLLLIIEAIGSTKALHEPILFLFNPKFVLDRNLSTTLLADDWIGI